MISNSKALSRRTVLGLVIATAVAPQVARGQEGNSSGSQEPQKVQIKMTINGQTIDAALFDNPSAHDFASMLPLDLKLEDYSTNEKITYLPRKLTEAGSGPFSNERPGDLCYFAPWGNLALFHGAYRYSSGPSGEVSDIVVDLPAVVVCGRCRRSFIRDLAAAPEGRREH